MERCSSQDDLERQKKQYPQSMTYRHDCTEQVAKAAVSDALSEPNKPQRVNCLPKLPLRTVQLPVRRVFDTNINHYV